MAKKPLVLTTMYSWFDVPYDTFPFREQDWVYPTKLPLTIGASDAEYWKLLVLQFAKAGFGGAWIGPHPPADAGEAAVNLTRLAALEAGLRKANRSFKVAPFLYDSTGDHIATFYEDFVLPFLASVKKNRWLRTPQNRLMLFIWNYPTGMSAATFTGHLTTLRDKVKDATGKYPFLIFEQEIITASKVTDATYIDGRLSWNAPIGGHVNQTHNDYSISSIGAGNNEVLIRPWRCFGDNPASPGYNSEDPVNNRKVRGTASNPASFLQAEFAKIPNDVDLVFLQDGQDLSEGAGISECTYPTPSNPVYDWVPTYTHGVTTLDAVATERAAADTGWYLPPDYYLTVMQQLIAGRWPHLVRANEARPLLPLYDAEFVSQIVPTLVLKGSTFAVTITMRNTGIQTWTSGLEFKLGSRNPPDNTTWGLSRVSLGGGDAIATGQTKAFTFNCTAPATPGFYGMQWRMVRGASDWLGVGGQNVASKNVQIYVK